MVAAPASAPLLAQSTTDDDDDLMQREIDDALATSRFRAGPFRLTPTLRVGGGSDSNPLSRPGPDPVEDVRFSVGPGVLGVVPMSNKALIELYEEVNFVYYRDLEQLRDVFNITRGQASLGGRDFVLHGRGELRTGQARPTSELDVPLNQDTADVGAGLDVALGSAQQLNLSYDNSRFRYQEAGEDVGVSVPNLLDRTEEAYRAQFERYVTATTSAVVEGLYDVIDYVDDSTQRDGRGYGALGGLVFSPRGDVRGQAMIGYKRLTPDVTTQAEFSGLIGSADVTFPLGNRFRVRGLYARDTRPSILENNWFFVENRFGGSVDVYLAERWFVRPSAVLGTNTYPRATTFVNSEGRLVTEVVRDDFQIYGFSINYELTPDVVLSVGGEQQLRDSNLPRFDKDRTLFNVGLTLGL